MKKKIKKDKVLQPRMKPRQERDNEGKVNTCMGEVVPVWYSQSGKVNPEWLSALKDNVKEAD